MLNSLVGVLISLALADGLANFASRAIINHAFQIISPVERDQKDLLDAVLVNVTGRVEEVLHKLIGVLLANHLASCVNDGADIIDELLTLLGE